MDIKDAVEVYTKFSSGNEKDFLEAEKMKNEIILHKQNIWILMQNVINPKFDPPLQLFITCLINDILKSSFKSLPLYEIMELLNLILVESVAEQREINENIMNSIIDLVGMLKFLIYVIDNRFFFNYETFDDKIQFFEFLSFFNYINSPPIFINDLFEEKEIVKLFINTQFQPLLFNLFEQIKNLSNEPIQILNQIIVLLLNQEKKKNEIDSEFSQFFINSLNDLLKIVEGNFEKFTPFYIIDLLSNILNYLNLNDDIPNLEIFESIFTILIKILSNSEIFLIEEKTINSLYNLMLNFPSFRKILDHCENYCSSFILFLHHTLENNYFLALRILSSSTEFLFNVFEYIQPIPAAKSDYSSLFMKFFIETIKSIENDPVLTFNGLFDGINELKMTKKILISLLQASEEKIDENIKFIIYTFNEIKKEEFKFSLVYDVKMSFVIYTSLIIIKYDFFESGEVKSDQNLTNFLFNEFIESFQRLDDYKNNEDMSQLYASERVIIEFFRIYVKKYIFNNNTKELAPIIPLSAFNSYNLVIDFIFSRLWKDIIIDLQLKQAGDVMSLLLNSKNFVEILTTTNCIQDSYENFLNFPSKYIVYKKISKVAIAQNFHKEFIQKVYDCFFEKFDEISVLKFFKLLCAFFQSASTKEIWLDIYNTFQAPFESQCETVSNINNYKIQKILLKFLNIFTQSIQKIEGDKKSEVPSYKLLIIHLLLNLGNNILNNITEDEKENADFDIDRWNIIELFILDFSLCIQSNCSNGELIFSEQENIFQIFSLLVFILSNTSFSSFLSHPQLILNLSNLFKILAQYCKEELHQNEQFWNFFMTSSKLILFNSNCANSINLISQSLCSFLNDYSLSLRNHFVVAFDALTRKDDLFLTVEFVILFFKVDEKFVFDLGKFVEDDLDDAELKGDFNQTYLNIWQYITDNENKISRHEIIHHVYPIIQEIQIKWHNLDCLEKCFVI